MSSLWQLAAHTKFKVTQCLLAGFEPSEFGYIHCTIRVCMSCHVDHFGGLDFQFVAKASLLGNVFWLRAGRRDAGSPI
jgi:hypothetical protein